MNAERAELLKGYSEEKKAWDSTFPWIFYVARPVSFPLTLALRKLGATPDGVTVFTAVLGLVSLPALASGRPWAMLLGGFLLLLYTIFDCVDGNLARAWPQTASRSGKYWDGLVGNFYLLSYFALGIGLGGELYITQGAAITVLKLLAYRIKSEFWQIMGKAWESDKASSVYRPHTGNWYYRVYYNFTDPQAHIFILVPLCAAGYLSWFISASFLVSCLDIAFTLALYLKRSAALRKQDVRSY